MSTHQLCLFVLLMSSAPLSLAAEARNPAGAKASEQAPPENTTHAVSQSAPARVNDDLSWLVGRWLCIARQYFTDEERIMASSGDSLLEYFNVYLPYADDHLTLALTENPDDRRVAAEFVTRSVHEVGAFRENPRQMFEGGPVGIGIQRIRYGSPVSPDFDFKYRTETKNGRLWLTLESKAMRFELIKLLADVGDLHHSFVSAPVMNYTEQQLLELRARYAALATSLQPRGPTPPTPQRKSLDAKNPVKGVTH